MIARSLAAGSLPSYGFMGEEPGPLTGTSDGRVDAAATAELHQGALSVLTALGQDARYVEE
jgi:hypothetical protein